MPNPVTDILARHGLSRPDGRPLCTYLVTDADLAALTSIVQHSDTLNPAAFVLAGAELWRRRALAAPLRRRRLGVERHHNAARPRPSLARPPGPLREGPLPGCWAFPGVRSTPNSGSW